MLTSSALCRVVHPESSDSGSSDGRSAFNDAGVVIDFEVFRPAVSARIIEPHNRLGDRIYILDMRPFTHITGSARKCQVVICISPIAHYRDDVFDFKREIEHGFGSTTVLATMPCT